MQRVRARGALRTALGVFAIATVLAGLSIVESRADPSPEARAIRVSGALNISNSRANRAVLVGRQMLPGDSVTGSVTISNSGAKAGLFELSAGGLADTPGTGGGVLSDDLRLVVEDATSELPAVLYDGPLSDMPVVPVGELGPGTDRIFRFTVTRPPASPQERYRSASTTVDFEWTAFPEEVGRCANAILGSAGDDTLGGSREGDTIDGGAGDDMISGGGGGDCLSGEEGDDVIDARDGGADEVACGPGDDTVLADPQDVVSGCERRR
jgi:Ca2+-binding RTX toxin-like protein